MTLLSHDVLLTQHNTCACLYCVRPCNTIKIRVWLEFEWLRNWVLCPVFLIVSIDVIADNGTWAVSVCCMVRASCVPHVGVWTIAHRNVVRIKVSWYRYMTLLLAAYCFRTNKVCTKQQATYVTSWTVRRNMRSDGRVLGFRAVLNSQWHMY